MKTKKNYTLAEGCGKKIEQERRAIMIFKRRNITKGKRAVGKKLKKSKKKTEDWQN